MSESKNTCCGYPVHEAAALFPLLPEAELKELAEDIKAKGLIYPIVKCDKLILDGRNRLLACEIAGVGAYFRDYKTYDSTHTPTEWVLATNSKRRQLTPNQRATIAAEAVPLIKKDVEGERRRKIAEARRGETVQKVAPSQFDERKTRKKAAKAMGVNHRYVDDAVKLKAEAPEVFERVKAGKITIPAAKKELGWVKPRQEPDRVDLLLAIWAECTKQEKSRFLKTIGATQEKQ